MKRYRIAMIFLLAVGLSPLMGCEPTGEDDSAPTRPRLEVENPNTLCYYPEEGDAICIELDDSGVALRSEGSEEAFEPFGLSSEELARIKCSKIPKVKFADATFEYTGSVWVLRNDEVVVDRFEADAGIAFVKMGETLWCKSFSNELTVIDLPGIFYTLGSGCTHEVRYITGIGTILIDDDADDYFRRRPREHSERILTLVTKLDQVTQGPEDFLVMQEDQWELVWQGPKASVLTYANGSIWIENSDQLQRIQFGNATLQYKIEGESKALYTTPEFKDQIVLLSGPENL